VPVGVAGELHIGGDSVGRGYLNRPELTGQRFIPDPWHRGAGPPGQRLYKSGDLVRRNADGTISFAGRVDDQVKIRGLRIELGEIETALTTHPSVAQALVTVAIDPAGDKELAGYYRLTTGPAGPADGDLRAHLSRTLPGYMIPARLIEVDAFPLTSNGKIDKAALPKPSTAGGHGTADEEHTSPATALEAAIGRLFAQVLKRGDVGITDNFFRVGGNSLQVMRLIDLVYRETGAELGAAAVFLHPSPRALAAAIESVRTGTTTGSANAGSLIRLTSGPGGLPLIVIHAVGGTVFAYTPLAAELAGTFQVHGLEAPVLRSAAATYETIADLADDYARRIRSAQPDGPYRLAGWSMGGILAFEITRRLETAGAVVGLLALLDAPYAIPAEGAPTTAQLTALFLVDAARSLGWDLTGLPDPASPPDGQLAWLAGRLGEDPDDDGGTGTEAITTQLTRRLDAFGTHQRLLASYQPAGPAVRAPTLIVSAARSPNALTRKLWPSVLGGQVSVLDVDGDHYEFLRPPMVADVATAILSWHGSLR
jgi:thioesterase domain-containing protein